MGKWADHVINIVLGSSLCGVLLIGSETLEVKGAAKWIVTGTAATAVVLPFVAVYQEVKPGRGGKENE